MGELVGQRALVAHRCPGRVKALAAALRRAGFAVRTATSGARAFAAASRWKPQVVAADARLCAPSADEIYRELKRLPEAPMFLLLADGLAGRGAADSVLVEPVAPSVVGEQARLLSQLRAARMAAEAAVAAANTRVRDQMFFVGAAAHDLRQPAQAVRLFLSALEQRLRDPAAATLLGHALDGLDALERLLHSLMDAAALEFGKLTPSLERIDLADLVHAVGSSGAPEAVRKRLKLRVRAMPVVVWSDRVLLERVLRNLVVNALRYTERGGVLVACRRNGGHAVVEVWDTGVGIPTEHLAAIFEDFHQLDGRLGHGGLGLGLAVVARTARMLGHDVSVASRVGRGSVFRLRLPLTLAP